MLRDEILRTIPEIKKRVAGNDVNDIPISSLKFGIAGSIALGKEKKNSDIDLVIDSDGFSLDAIDFIKSYLHDLFKRKVDILFLPLLRKERISAVGLSVAGASAFQAGQALPGYIAAGEAMLAYLPLMILLSVPAGIATGWICIVLIRRVGKKGKREKAPIL